MAQVRFKKRIFASAGMRLRSGEVGDHRFISLSDTDFATLPEIMCGVSEMELKAGNSGKHNRAHYRGTFSTIRYPFLDLPEIRILFL